MNNDNIDVYTYLFSSFSQRKKPQPFDSKNEIHLVEVEGRCQQLDTRRAGWVAKLGSLISSSTRSDALFSFSRDW